MAKKIAFENQAATKKDVADAAEHVVKVLTGLMDEKIAGLQGSRGGSLSDVNRKLDALIKMHEDDHHDLQEVKRLPPRVDKIENQLYENPTWVRMPADVADLKQKVFKK